MRFTLGVNRICLFVLAELNSFIRHDFTFCLSLGQLWFLVLFYHFFRGFNTFHDSDDIFLINSCGLAFVDSKDLVGLFKGLQSMCNHDDEGDVWFLFQVCQNCLLVDAVESWGALVQDKDLGVSEDGSGDGYSLLLASTEFLEGNIEAKLPNKVADAAYL